jgi:phage gp29-like protein
MKLTNRLGIYTKKEAIKNFSRKEKAQAKNIEVQQLERAAAQIESWRQALQYAEDVEAPDRTELIRLYNEVLLDDGVDGFVESLENRIHASDFDVVDGEGNVKEDARNIFNQEWFDEIVSSYVLAILKGYRLIEMFPKDGRIDRLKDIFIFPDHYVIPQWRQIMTQEGAVENTISYDPGMQTLIEMGNARKYGILNSIIPLYIYKKNALQYWSNFQSKFGIPPVVAKTDLRGETARNNMFTFLKQLASNSIGVIGRDDEIHGLQANSVDGYNTFNEMKKAMDEAIQRRLEGQTMTSQEGSSRAQAEVHERTGDIWFYGRLSRFKRMINTQVIPLLANNGFPVAENDQIRYKENKDLTAVIEHILKLKQAGYKVDPEWVEETTGYPLEEIEQQTQPGSAMAELENLYNSL